MRQSKNFIRITLVTGLLFLIPQQVTTGKSLWKPDDINFANNAVITMYQDILGRMWFGTYDGLYLFDGEETHTFRSNARQINSISSNIIDKLYSAGKEHMWIVTSVGLDLFSLRKREVVEKYAGYNGIRRLASDENGYTLLLSKENELLYYSPKLGYFSKTEFVNATPENIALIVAESNETFLLIKNDGTIVRYTFDSSGKPLISAPEILIQNKIVRGISTEETNYLIDSTGQLWRYTPRQSCSIIADLNQLNSYGNWITLHSIVELDDGLYAGLLQGGLFHLNKNNSWNCITNDYRIFSLWKDRFRPILWLGTDGYGTYMYCEMKRRIHGIRLENLPVKTRKPIRAIYVDNNNDLWIGTKGSGVFQIKGYENLTDKKIPEGNITHFSGSNGLTSSDVYSIVPSKIKKIVWIIGNAGLSYYSYEDNLMHSLSRYSDSDLILKGFDFCEVNDSTAYVTTTLGLVQLTLDMTNNPLIKSFKVIKFEKNNISCSELLPLMEESDSTLLIGTRGGCGVIRFNLNTEEYELLKTDNLNIALGDILSISKGQQGTLYCGVSSGLMVIPDDGDAIMFDFYDGMANDMVHGVLEDMSGYVWLSTNKGLTCYNPKERFFFNYSSPYRLPVFEFSDNAYWRHPVTGRLFFGGVDGLVWFDPALLMHEGDYKPTLRLTELSTSDNKHVALYDDGNLEEIKIKPSISQFTLSFAMGDYINGKDYEYTSMLKGYDKKWQTLQNKNDITFTNIPPGRYTLCIRYRSNASDVDTDTYTAEIIVIPPWYSTILAKIIYVLLAVFIICGVVWLIRRRVQNEQIQLIKRRKEEEREKLYEAKQNFFVNISHELCTPLTLINGINGHFQELAQHDSALATYTKVLDNNVANLNVLIQEILDFRKIEEHKHTEGVKIDTVNVTALFERLLNSFSEAIDRDEITVHCNIAGDLHWQTNAGYINKIVTNLLSNAVKYTNRKGEIRLSALIIEDKLVMTFYNTGQGIPREKQDLIFDRYAVLEEMDTNMYLQAASRHGLGLSISQSLAEALGGKISVRSTEGVFSEFTIELPVMESTETRDINLSTAYSAGDISPNTNDIPVETCKLATGNDKKPVIFVVDDNADIVWLIRTELGQEFNIIGCNSAKEALEQAKKVTPDLIITDIVMPEMDGLDLIREISNNRYTSRVPIIIISAKITDKEQAIGLDQGADAYLTKPFSMVVLRSAMNRLLSERDSLKEYYSRPESAFTIANGQPIHQNDKEFMDMVIGIIADNIEKSELKPEFIADQLAMAPRSLCNKVKDLSGYTPSELIKNYRFSMAGHLLLTTRLTIQEVMYEVGISSKSYFSREFLRTFGMNPGEYRNR
ncbi:MAG: response regulator [Odoribacteraceae bacterium]|jgi:signal transduction histidine kinase/DNA-binding response OmpR family regulator/ligand-binding sensor domain-containing protein|nr:response regulator [Odoribacteraceae bacterium]